MKKYKMEGIRKFDGEMTVRKEKVGQNVLLQGKKSEKPGDTMKKLGPRRSVGDWER